MDKQPLLITSGPAFEAMGLIHRVLTPETDGPYPTVVMLHGYLGNEDVMWIFARTAPPDWLLLAPRAGVRQGEEAYSWHPPGNETWPRLAEFDDAVTAVAQFIRALPQHYNADPQQIYLMGFSQGAALAYAIAIHHPGLVQGIAGLVGFVPVDAGEAIENAPLRDLPVLMLAGMKDETIPLTVAHAGAETLRAAGAYLEYREYDTGHKLNAQGMRKLKKWWAERAK